MCLKGKVGYGLWQVACGKWHVADDGWHLGFYLPRKAAFEWENLNSLPKSPDNCPNWDFSMQLSLT